MYEEHSIFLDPLLDGCATITSCGEAEEVCREHFAIIASATALGSERDSNFRMRSADGRDYLLRITNSAEDMPVINLQTNALRHLEKVAPHIPVPRMIVSRNHAYEVLLARSDGKECVARLMTFLPGRPLSAVVRPEPYLSLVAHVLADLDAGLCNFDHPAANHSLLWDVTKAIRIRPMLESIADQGRRNLAVRLLNEYEEYVVPRFQALRQQVIHNDFNPDNILISDEDVPCISGIIDFGDIVRAPLINDLATAAAYLPIDEANPLQNLADLTARYHRKLVLTALEVDVLFDLVRARQVMVAVISEWRAKRYPLNRDYILRNNPHAWKCLERFGAISRSNAQQMLHRACSLEERDGANV